MDFKTELNVFLVIGVILLSAAVIMMGLLIYRYITGMRAQGFFGGKRKDEEK
jgi:hypothetical protein